MKFFVLLGLLISPFFVIAQSTSCPFSLGQDVLVCAGDAFALNLKGPVTGQYQWTGNTAGLSCTDCASPILTTSAPGTFQYMMTYTAAQCTFSDTILVLVSSKMPVQFPTDTKLCFGEKIQLNTFADPATTYKWTASDPAFGTVTTNQPELVPQKTATYFVVSTNVCGTRQDQVRVEVSNGALRISNDTMVCRGDSIALVARGNEAGLFTWSNGQTGQIANVLATRTQTYNVRYTYGDGCVETDSVVLKVANEIAEVTFPKDTSLCAGESIQLNVMATPGASYEWSSNPPGLNSSSPTPIVMPNQTTTYMVTTKYRGCLQSKTLTVKVAKATLVEVTKDTLICKGGRLTLRGVGQSIEKASYLWLLNGDTLAKNDTWSGNIYKAGTYNMVYTYGDGCKIERSVNVTLRPGLDTVNIVADPDTTKIFSGESITLRAVVSPTQNLNGFQFTWLENQTTTVGSGETLTISRTTGETKSSFKYLITAQSPNGCKKTEEFTLTVCPDIVVIPNAFTPDGDGENDTFGMSVLAGIVKAESFEVYNRWGELIFQSNDPNPRWDGTINGQPAPTDTYIYILQYRHGDGRLDPKQGAILLLR